MESRERMGIGLSQPRVIGENELVANDSDGVERLLVKMEKPARPFRHPRPIAVKKVVEKNNSAVAETFDGDSKIVICALGGMAAVDRKDSHSPLAL